MLLAPRIVATRAWLMAWLGAALALVPAARARAASATADSLDALVARWVASVGGGESIARNPGTHLTERTVVAGVPGTSESWITRKGFRYTLVQGRDRAEWVRDRANVWVHDWNGRTHPLEGRDRADAVTEAFLRSLLYVGPSSSWLRGAHATDAGNDST